MVGGSCMPNNNDTNNTINNTNDNNNNNNNDTNNDNNNIDIHNINNTQLITSIMPSGPQVRRLCQMLSRGQIGSTLRGPLER